MESLLEKLKAGKSATKTVTLDGVELGFRLLSENDYLEAGLAVIDFFKNKKIDDVNMASAELFESEKATQLLLRALVVPGSEQSVADSPLQLRKVLTRENKAWLIEQYLEFEKNYSPRVGHNISDDEFDRMLETLKKTPAIIRLSDLSSDTLKRLITALVSPADS
jgi:HEPN domain-containing protein